MLWDINVQCDDVGKKTRRNFNWHERAKGDNNRYCCTRWCKSSEKERESVEKHQDLKREIGRLWKLKMIEVVPPVIGCSTYSPWKCHKRIWPHDWKTADSKQCGSDANECIVGNCEDIEKSVGDVKKRSSVRLWSFVMTRLSEEITAMTTARTWC